MTFAPNSKVRDYWDRIILGTNVSLDKTDVENDYDIIKGVVNLRGLCSHWVKIM